MLCVDGGSSALSHLSDGKTWQWRTCLSKTIQTWTSEGWKPPVQPEQHQPEPEPAKPPLPAPAEPPDQPAVPAEPPDQPEALEKPAQESKVEPEASCLF